MSAQEIPPDAPVPRLCHLVKWADFDGYGFNLHAEKSRSGQFIGKVDEDSPAQHAGLREGDRIIEVNGVNIANENHRQVVERIKSIPNETKLLVLDEVADSYYKERKIVVKSTQPNVKYIKTPVPRPPVGEPPSYENISLPVNGVEKPAAVENGIKGSPKVTKSEVQSNGSAVYRSPADQNASPLENTKQEKTPKDKKKSEALKEQSPKSSNDTKTGSPKAKEEVNSRSSTPMDGSLGSAPDSPHSTKSSRSSGANSVGGGSSQNGPSSCTDGDGGLNLNMSASEMRQMLAARKKRDPKKEPMDIRQKFEIIQQM